MSTALPIPLLWTSQKTHEDPEKKTFWRMDIAYGQEPDLSAHRRARVSKSMVLCIDMCIDMFTTMNVDTCAGMCIDIRTDMCVDMCAGMDMRAQTCA